MSNVVKKCLFLAFFIPSLASADIYTCTGGRYKAQVELVKYEYGTKMTVTETTRTGDTCSGLANELSSSDRLSYNLSCSPAGSFHSFSLTRLMLTSSRYASGDDSSPTYFYMCKEQ